MRKQYYHLFYISFIVHLHIAYKYFNKASKYLTELHHFTKRFTLDFAESLVAESVEKLKKTNNSAQFCAIFSLLLQTMLDLWKKTSTEQNVKQIKTRTE